MEAINSSCSKRIKTPLILYHTAFFAEEDETQLERELQ
jgi:hypothetical protein